jgi:general nucleoside transport system ATP-binding protein
LKAHSTVPARSIERIASDPPDLAAEEESAFAPFQRPAAADPAPGPTQLEQIPLLRLESITKRFGSIEANRDVSLALQAGEIHAIVGENGAGKTTLINILFGIYQADSGTIFVEGNPTMISSPRKAIELGIALVSQHFLLVERHTVAENLALALPSLGVRFSPARMSKRLSILNQAYGIGLELDTRVTDLSPGQKQRVEIAKALLRQSRLIVLDEPTSVLTPQEARELFQILGRLRQKGCAILFISHKLDEVLAISERISILRKGRLIETVLRQDADKIRLSRAMMGSAVSLPAKPETVVRSEARLVVEQMTLGETAAPVSFQIASGEILGIAGVAGNGQSELAQTLTGLRHAGKAQITLDGYPLQGLDAKQFHARGVAHIPEDRNRLGIVPSMSVEENFLLRWINLVAFRMGPFLRLGKLRRAAENAVNAYSIVTPSVQTRTSLLSGGNIQKLIFARELSEKPQLIVAVHPTYGLDVQAIAQVHRCLLDQAANGAAVLLISEDLEELMLLSDCIAVLFNKQIIAKVARADAKIEHIGLWMTGHETI